jgi:hypothetical protein
MTVNVYLIEDDERKPLWLCFFCECLQAKFPGIAFKPKNQAKGYLDSANVEFLIEALRDPSGIVLLDLLLKAPSRVIAAGLLKTRELLTQPEIDTIWRQFDGPQNEETLLASVFVAAALKHRTRVVWVSTQSEIMGFYRKLPRATRFPQIYWPRNDQTPTSTPDSKEAVDRWNDDSPILAPLVEFFRQPYLEAAARWDEMVAKVKQECFTRNDGEKHCGLFPETGTGHNVSELNEECILANSAGVKDLVDVAIGSIPPRTVSLEDLFILKAATRGKQQLYAPTMLRAFGNSEGNLNNYVLDTTPCLAGPYFLAAVTMIRNGWKLKAIDVAGQKISVALYLECASQEEANAAVETLKLTPRDRMKRDDRIDDPGECVLALDYLKPVEIIAQNNCVIITFERKLHPIQ